MLKGYKYEILPSEEQKELIWKTITKNNKEILCTQDISLI